MLHACVGVGKSVCIADLDENLNGLSACDCVYLAHQPAYPDRQIPTPAI